MNENYEGSCPSIPDEAFTDIQTLSLCVVKLHQFIDRNISSLHEDELWFANENIAKLGAFLEVLGKKHQLNVLVESQQLREQAIRSMQDWVDSLSPPEGWPAHLLERLGSSQPSPEPPLEQTEMTDIKKALMNDENGNDDPFSCDDDDIEVAVTEAKVTRDEVEKLVKLYLGWIDEIRYRTNAYEQIGSNDWADNIYMGRRISDFIKADAIAEQRVAELEKEIAGDTYSPVNLAKARLAYVIQEENYIRERGLTNEEQTSEG